MAWRYSEAEARELMGEVMSTLKDMLDFSSFSEHRVQEALTRAEYSMISLLIDREFPEDMVKFPADVRSWSDIVAKGVEAIDQFLGTPPPMQSEVVLQNLGY